MDGARRAASGAGRGAAAPARACGRPAAPRRAAPRRGRIPRESLRSPRARRWRSQEPASSLTRGYGGALPADAHDRGVGQVGAETVLLPEPAGQGREDLEVDLLLGTAAPADEVPVALGVGPEPPRYPVVEVRVGDVAELLEHLEVAVDGGG